VDEKRALRVWSRVVSPAIPMAFAVVLSIVCFANAAAHPGAPVWIVLGIIGVVIVVGGVATMLLLRRHSTRTRGRWP
jgi:predicted phage tail protein